MKVKDLFKIRKGKKANSEVDDYQDGAVRYIQIEDLRNDNNIKYCINDDDAIIAKENDIIIAWDGANAATSNYNLNGAIGSTLARLRPKRDDFFLPYVGLFVKSKQQYLRDKCTGATIPHVDRQVLQDLEVPLPDYDVQERIVKLIENVDTLRQKRRQTIEKLYELTQSVFLDMFGDPATNSKGLEEVELGKLTDIQGGYAFKSKNFVDKKNAIKVVKIANVHYKDIDWSDMQHLPPGKLEEHYKYALSENDILLALTRPIINSLDAVKAVVVQKSDLPALLNQRVARIRINSERVTQEYIASFICTQYFKRQIEKYASTSLQPNVSIKEVNKIRVLVPSLEEQRRFSAIKKKILLQSSSYEYSSLELNNLFNSLLQNAFKGELNFNNTEEELLAAEVSEIYTAG